MQHAVIVIPIGHNERVGDVSASGLPQQGHRPSNPRVMTANAEGCGKVRIALNASRIRVALWRSVMPPTACPRISINDLGRVCVANGTRCQGAHVPVRRRRTDATSQLQ